MAKRCLDTRILFAVLCLLVTVLLVAALKYQNLKNSPLSSKKVQVSTTMSSFTLSSTKKIDVSVSKSNLTFTLNPRAKICPTDLKPGVYEMTPIDQSQKRTKRILFWNRPSDWWLKFDKCEYKDCVITDDKCDFPQSDAILFHAPNLWVKYVPKRVPGQIYVYMGHEPPERMYTSYKDKKWRKVFNWTWSYRRDADICAPYGKIVPNDKKVVLGDSFEKLLKSKKKQAAIFVSHCDTEAKRQEYVKLMQKYIDVDVYGKCGKLKCAHTNNNCDKMLDENYKFYLGFENSLCQDYVTEKSLHRARHTVVPVIRGDNYLSMYFPPNSYINTRNFSSVKSLSEYLLKVSSDENEYRKFFEWKKYYRTDRESTHGLCKLCKMLHNVDRHKSIYDDIESWATQINEKPICIKKPTDLD